MSREARGGGRYAGGGARAARRARGAPRARAARRERLRGVSAQGRASAARAAQEPLPPLRECTAAAAAPNRARACGVAFAFGRSRGGARRGGGGARWGRTGENALGGSLDARVGARRNILGHTFGKSPPWIMKSWDEGGVASGIRQMGARECGSGGKECKKGAGP